jgi:hypothetical protein
MSEILRCRKLIILLHFLRGPSDQLGNLVLHRLTILQRVRRCDAKDVNTLTRYNRSVKFILEPNFLGAGRPCSCKLSAV